MEEEKRKKIEEQLRQMIALTNQSQTVNRPGKSRPGGVRVIRRRKGQPDMHIA